MTGAATPPPCSCCTRMCSRSTPAAESVACRSPAPAAPTFMLAVALKSRRAHDARVAGGTGNKAPSVNNRFGRRAPDTVPGLTGTSAAAGTSATGPSSVPDARTALVTAPLPLRPQRRPPHQPPAVPQRLRRRSLAPQTQTASPARVCSAPSKGVSQAMRRRAKDGCPTLQCFRICASTATARCMARCLWSTCARTGCAFARCAVR